MNGTMMSLVPDVSVSAKPENLKAKSQSSFPILVQLCASISNCCPRQIVLPNWGAKAQRSDSSHFYPHPAWLVFGFLTFLA